MTRKEATEIIQKLIEASDLWDCTKEAEALRVAIEALSAPSGDPISRADAIKITEETGALETQARIKRLPSAEISQNLAKPKK